MKIVLAHIPLVVSGVNLAMIAKGRLGDWGTGGEEEEMIRLFPPLSTSTDALKARILEFVEYFNRTMAKPFKWTYKGKPLCN